MDKQIEAIITNIPQDYQEAARKNISYIIDALDKEGILTPEVLSYALATVQHESGFVPKEEILADPSKNSRNAYIAQLQNNYEGGQRFKGRGYIQLTHKGNYEKYGKRIGEDLANNPEKLLEPEVSAKVLAAYFKDAGVVDAIEKGDYNTARVRIQGRGALNSKFLPNTRAIAKQAQQLNQTISATGVPSPTQQESQPLEQPQQIARPMPMVDQPQQQRPTPAPAPMPFTRPAPQQSISQRPMPQPAPAPRASAPLSEGFIASRNQQNTSPMRTPTPSMAQPPQMPLSAPRPTVAQLTTTPEGSKLSNLFNETKKTVASMTQPNTLKSPLPTTLVKQTTPFTPSQQQEFRRALEGPSVVPQQQYQPPPPQTIAVTPQKVPVPITAKTVQMKSGKTKIATPSKYKSKIGMLVNKVQRGKA